MSFADAIRAGYAQYFSIGGRAARAEYWWFVLYTVMAMLMIGMAAVLAVAYLGVAAALAEQVTVVIYAVVFLVPLMTALVRRLHDIGRSGWWVLVATVLPQIAGSGYLVVSAGTSPMPAGSAAGFSLLTTVANLMSLTVLAMSVWPSQKRDNKYGPVPAARNR